jgi:DNA-binding XRE family transcriptional regulator
LQSLQLFLPRAFARGRYFPLQLCGLTTVAEHATYRAVMAETASALREYRDDQGLTLEQLGALFGVNKSTVMRWEEGQIPPSRAIEVEQRTGIPRHRLRPDLWESARPERVRA